MYKEVIVVDDRDNFITYPIKQYISGILLMCRVLADIEAGLLSYMCRNYLPSAVWLQPTLWQYLAARRKRGVH